MQKNSHDVSTLPDNGALLIIISHEECKNVHLRPESALRNITVADGKTAQVLGEAIKVSLCLGKLTVPLNILVLADSPFDLINGMSVMEALGVSNDLHGQMAKP